MLVREMGRIATMKVKHSRSGKKNIRVCARLTLQAVQVR